MTTLYIRDGEIYREADGREVLDKAQAIIAQRYRAGAPALTSPARTAEFLKLKLGGLDYEVFGFLALDLCVARRYVERAAFGPANSDFLHA